MVNFILVLSVLVVFHELGHYLAARYFGVKVESFSIGFGPKLFGFDHNGTDFKVCLLPLGGYVKMAGHALTEEIAYERDGLSAKPRWQRLIILAAGPAFNFILAIGLLTGVYMYQYSRAAYLDETARIGYVAPGSAADQAGIRTDDVVRSIDGVETPTWKELIMASTLVVDSEAALTVGRDGTSLETSITIPERQGERGVPDPGWSAAHRVELVELVPGLPAVDSGLEVGDLLASINGSPIIAIEQVADLVGGSDGQALLVEVERDGERRSLKLRPRLQDEGWRLGIVMRPIRERIEEELSFSAAFGVSVKENLGFASIIFRSLGKLIMGEMAVTNLEGPVGIYEHTQAAASFGVDALIQFMALISVNLGVINLAPVPVLDGGQILLLFVESILRRDVSMQVKQRITQAGLLFIILLFGLVMYNDLARQFFSP